jgi:hypothetical protein
MGAYWQRFTQSMVDFVIAGRSDKTPMSVHRKPLVSNPYLALPSQSAISYANSQKLGFTEWDESRGGWIAYTIHLPESWRNFVNVVEDRLIMLSKRGKGSKRDAPADLAIEKTPKKPTPSVPSSKKAPSKKAKAVKKDKPPLLVSSAAKESTTALVQESTESAIAPPKRKTRAGKESKSTPSMPSATEESTTAPFEEPTESTGGPSKKTKDGKKSKSTASVSPAVKESTTTPVEEPTESTVTPSSKPKSVGASPPKQTGKKSAASRPPKGQKKTSVSSSSPDEEEPSAMSTPSSPKKKKFIAPLFPLGAAGRARSKSGPKVSFLLLFPLLLFLCFTSSFPFVFSCFSLRQVTHGSGGSGGGVVVVKVTSSSFLCIFSEVVFIFSDFYHLFLLQDSDVADDDVVASPLGKDAPRAAAVDQAEDLGKSAADSSEVNAESTGEDHFSSSGSFFDSVLDSVPEEQIVSAGSTADDDDMPEADDSSMGPADSMEEDLAIVPHVSQGRDDDSTVDVDADPISFSVPQIVLTSRVTGMPYSFIISLSSVDEEHTHVYLTYCVLICRRP